MRSAPCPDVLDNAVAESVLGSLSYNGQRCTALKLLFVPAWFADDFVDRLVAGVEALPVGPHWQSHNASGGAYSGITPLPHPGRVASRTCGR